MWGAWLTCAAILLMVDSPFLASCNSVVGQIELIGPLKREVPGKRLGEEGLVNSALTVSTKTYVFVLNTPHYSTYSESSFTLCALLYFPEFPESQISEQTVVDSCSP